MMGRHPAFLRYEDAIATARTWVAAGGRPEVELGALEPMLWRQGEMRVEDLIRGLVENGFRVTMTSNGSLLRGRAAGLRRAGLSRLRVSWHTTDPRLFRDISGGTGHYDSFYAGLLECAEAGLDLTFNRLLLQGHTSDLDVQLDLVSRHGLRLKLYDLMGTPDTRSLYRRYFQDWRPVVARHVQPRTARSETFSESLGRRRIRYHLFGGGVVEVKVGDTVDRSHGPCVTCPHRLTCLEAYGDYVRVTPSRWCYACYLRKDLGFGLERILHAVDPVPAFRAGLARLGCGLDPDAMLGRSSLRLTVVAHCNFRCRFPGSKVSWCLEQRQTQRQIDHSSAQIRTAARVGTPISEQCYG